MNLRDWALLLSAADTEVADIDWRVADALVALLAGAGTSEGSALRTFYRGGDRSDAETLAALSAALIRLSECDDIHLPSCVTPGSVTVPVALALAAEAGDDAKARIGPAIAAGYSAGMRLGSAIGRAEALAVGVWPTLLCAPLMSAVTASIVNGHDAERLAHAMALSLAGRNGRLGRPSGTPSGRWLAVGEAVASGIRASRAAGDGFHGDLDLISEPWLASASAKELFDPAAFDFIASDPSTTSVGFKPFATSRQSASAIVAFQRVLARGLDPRNVEWMIVSVPPVYAAMLSRPVVAGDRLSTLMNVGYQCACAAFAPELLYDVERSGPPRQDLLDFSRRVEVRSAPELAHHYPQTWPARLEITAEGQTIEEEAVRIAGDAGEQGTREMLADKFQRLAAGYAGFAGAAVALLSPGSADRRFDLWARVRNVIEGAQQIGALRRAAQG